MAVVKDKLSAPEDRDEQWQKNKDALLARLKRTEGQLRGIQAMIEADVECEKVAQQMAAARKALDRAFYNMLSGVMERELACRQLDSATAHERLHYATRLLSKYG